MNATKEVEYIAEIVRLKRKLKKSDYESSTTNEQLLGLAEKCINKVANNIDGKPYFYVVKKRDVEPPYASFLKLRLSIETDVY